MKSVLKYPGAKQRIADWVISHFPPHRSYLEPFMGSLAVLLNKEHSPIETVNDLDDDVVNLFRLIRDNPRPLCEAVEFTPYSRTEYDRAFSSDEADPVEKARRFLVRSWQSHGYKQFYYKVGWKRDVAGREAAYAVRGWKELPAIIALAAERLKDVQIEHANALELIKGFNGPDVLIYADPPYVLSSRGGKAYRHEMTDQEHVRLLEVLLRHRGPVVLSGYDNQLYRDYLEGWSTDTLNTFASHAQPRVETLWMNFEAPPTLFDLLEDGA